MCVFVLNLLTTDLMDSHRGLEFIVEKSSSHILSNVVSAAEAFKVFVLEAQTIVDLQVHLGAIRKRRQKRG